MNLRRLPRAPSPALGVALVALCLAMSGSVMAGVQLGKNSVGTKQLKNAAVKGANIANDAITGKQIDEGTLGTVPRAATAGTATAAQAASTATTAKSADRAASADRAMTAANADRAADADRLSGHAAKDFASATEVFPVAVKLGANESRTLLERDGLKIVAVCRPDVPVNNGTTGHADQLTITAESSTDYATLDSSSTGNTLDGSGGVFLGPGTAEAKRLLIQAFSSSAARTVRMRPAFTATSTNGSSVFVGGSNTTTVTNSGGNATATTTGNIRITFGLYGALCSVSEPVVVATL